MKALIRCPVCESRSKLKSLAEYLPDGTLAVLRWKGNPVYNTFDETTIIAGDDFVILCGNCKQIAFRKIPFLIQQTFGTL